MAEQDTPELEEGQSEAEIFTLTDEEGVEHVFELVDSLDLDEDYYYALVPYVDENNLEEEDGELVILKSELDEETGEEYLAPIEDDDEYEHIAGIFAHRLEELYDIEE